MTAATSWQHDVYGVLRAHDVTQFSYVPDAGHMILIDLSIADPDVHAIALTTEEEGVALAAGANLGDARSNVCSYLKSGRTSGCPRTAASCHKRTYEHIAGRSNPT